MHRKSCAADRAASQSDRLPHSLLERGRREFPDVISDIRGPGLGQLVETLPFACKQGPGRFLETRSVPRHGRHEPVSRLLPLADTILAFVHTPGHFHELAKRDGRTSRLTVQPVPVPRQQRDLTGHHAQFRAPRTSRARPVRIGNNGVRFDGALRRLESLPQ
jgi:hypothetical protein